MDDDLLKRITMLELSNQQLTERTSALQLVVSWLLAKHPDDDSMLFLSSQANELNDSLKYEEWVAVLDELREDLVKWRAQWPSDPHKPEVKNCRA